MRYRSPILLNPVLSFIILIAGIIFVKQCFLGFSGKEALNICLTIIDNPNYL
jgi:hypothetical protein